MEKAIVIHSFTAQQEGDLSLQVREEITVLKQNQDGWWQGRNARGQEGVFPMNMIKMLPPTAPSDPIEFLRVTEQRPVQQVNQKFKVQLRLRSGQSYSATKMMNDVRTLCEAFNQMKGSSAGITRYDVRTESVTEIPIWADNCSLPRQLADLLARERAEFLQDYLFHFRADRRLELLLLVWLDPSMEATCSEKEYLEIKDLLLKAETEVLNRPRPENIRLCEALYSYKTHDSSELSFEKGEIFALLGETTFTEWYNGERYNGGKGIFPLNYVRVLDEFATKQILFPLGNSVNKYKLGDLGYQSTMKSSKSGVDQRESVPSNPTAPQGPRERRRIEKYKVCSIDAFDALLNNGISFEVDGQFTTLSNPRNPPAPGDKVVVEYSGYLLDAQSQCLLEFLSSDELRRAPGEKDPLNMAPGPLVFQIDDNNALDGVNEAVSKMDLNQTVRAIIAPVKAYQELQFAHSLIPKDSYVVFDLTLKSIERSSIISPKPVAPSNSFEILASANHRNTMVERQRSNTVQSGMSQKDTDSIDENALDFLSSSTHKQNTLRRKQVDHQAGKSKPKPPKMLPSFPPKQQNEVETIPLARLQEIVRFKQCAKYRIDPKKTEDYLDDDDFQRAFALSRDAWQNLSPGNQLGLKRRAGLF